MMRERRLDGNGHDLRLGPAAASPLERCAIVAVEQRLREVRYGRFVLISNRTIRLCCATRLVAYGCAGVVSPARRSGPTMSRLSRAIALAMLALLVVATPAGASKGWCRTDPVVLIGGGVA